MFTFFFYLVITLFPIVKGCIGDKNAYVLYIVHLSNNNLLMETIFIFLISRYIEPVFFSTATVTGMLHFPSIDYRYYIGNFDGMVIIRLSLRSYQNNLITQGKY